MTKKDFTAIAKAINDGALVNCATEGEVTVQRQVRLKIAHQIARHAGLANPRFDHERFLTACGFPE